jgi:hypothetical protein
MAQTCARCSCCNPDEALFCHHDGAPLRAASADTVDPGSRPFPMPFVFPSGQSCRTFDQLALACLQNWSAAQELLKDGFLAGFLGGIGRADLAQVAREAAKNPDPDRGLDQLLARLPARSVEPPRLFVEPRAINLGRLKPGDDSRIELRLRNGGMGLLHGSIDCEEGVWVSLGDTPGVRQKHFQFLDHAEIAVQVVGQQLRANSKPLEARLTLQWNGGTETVVLTADVPVKPFPEGALAGATSPREAASKAKLDPRGAARLFETGAVAGWYKDNGWTYPVQGTAASGVASVQQFFEALGLTTPPKVEIDQTQISMAGRPGETLLHTLKVSTAEKRPVYARAVTDRPWLQVNGVDLEGRSATVHLAVNPVPDSPGETLNAKVIVLANGNQRFVVPVVVSVVGTRAPRSGALPVARVVAAEAVAATPSPSLSRAAAPILGVAVDEPPPYATPVEPPRRDSRVDREGYDRPRRRQRREGGRARHLIPVALLALALIGTVVRDFVIAREAPKEDVGGTDPDVPLGPPALELRFHDVPLDGALGSSGL